MAQAERDGQERTWFCPFDSTSFTDDQVTDATCPRCGGVLSRVTRAGEGGS